MKNLKVKRFLALALLAVSLFAVAVPAMAQTGIPAGPAWTNIQQVIVRSGPGTNYGILTKLSRGTQVRIIISTNTSGGWYYVHAAGYYGYIREDLLSSNPNAGIIGGGLGVGSSSRIDAPYVNIRSGAGTNYSIVMTTPNTTAIFVQVVGVSSPVSGYIWYQVQLVTQPYAGTVGWVRGDYLSGTT